MKVHQFLLEIGPFGDAIGNEVFLMQKILLENGYESDIYCEAFHPEVQAKHYSEYTKESSPDNLLIYHHAIGCNIPNFIRDLPDKKILIYHNITPPHFFLNSNKSVIPLLTRGRDQTCLLAPYIDAAFGDSEYNRMELVDAGYKKTGVLPILIDFDKYPEPDPLILKKLQDTNTNILFVGRIAPNKCHADIIKTFYYYKKIDPSARLLLPGNHEGFDEYYSSLKRLVKTLNIPDVFFPGKITSSELVSYYHAASIFLCMSEHEGFNVPLVESMKYNIPIIAYNSCAIPFTLGGSGVLINKKKYVEIAELIHIIKEDGNLKEKIIKRQRSQFESFDFNKTKEQFLSIIKEFT